MVSDSADQFQAAVRARYHEARSVLEPRVRAAMMAQGGPMSLDTALALNVSQNVLREALEVVLQESLPQGRDYFGELAIRIACYVLTACHPDDQRSWRSRFVRAFSRSWRICSPRE